MVSISSGTPGVYPRRTNILHHVEEDFELWDFLRGGGFSSRLGSRTWPVRF